MTLVNERSIGLLVCGGFQGTSVTKQAYDLIVKYNISTMILLKKNAHSVSQMSKLVRDLQYIAYNEAGYEYPLAFAIDEEGGMMNSLFDSDSLSQFPGAMALGATGDPELVYEVLRALAIELRHIGFLIILGPVLDVVIKLSHQLVSVRSFGTTIEEVVKYGRSCARGLRDGGLITVGKHFPGIGSARVDSLLELPMMTDSLDQIRRFNLVPFAELIREGLLDGISAAGCGVPTISPDETHACLLPVLLTKLLREDLGFEGFVISECLEMDALYHSIGLGQGVVLALYAGCDLVMVCHDLKLQVEAIESIKIALDNGSLDELIVNNSLTRLEKVRKKLPSWQEIFPGGSKVDLMLFKDAHLSLWHEHQKLMEKAYGKSITLVRDFEGVLPLSQYVGKDPRDSILILTPLLKPIYSNPGEGMDQKNELYQGEEVFREFGSLLSLHPKNMQKDINVLHTTYTANGLTALHEQLIDYSKAVIVITSEAQRNMYQIGIVKYISMLCGATPLSLSRANGRVQLEKPLVIVATLSPYDFFYNKCIGSVYLCCFDYTKQALKELANVLMGEKVAEGCIPGEKRFAAEKSKKRRLLSLLTPNPEKIQVKVRKSIPPKRIWLVDEMNVARDWKGLLKLCKNNSRTLSLDTFLRKFFQLLHISQPHQKHFVVRNSSLNIIYGLVMTWVDVLKSDDKLGKIFFILVDRSKRLQLIGKCLHIRALRYLIDEELCTKIRLGSLFPLLEFLGDNAFADDGKLTSFFNNAGWAISESTFLRKEYVMVLQNLTEWSVPTKIFRELTIVGIRFDVCLQPTRLQEFLDRVAGNRKSQQIYQAFIEALFRMDPSNAQETKIIVALEPTNLTVIGSIIVFSSKSWLSGFFPAVESEVSLNEKATFRGGIVSPLVDLSYSNLTEIFKYGLICSAVTSLRTNFSEAAIDDQKNKCFLIDYADENSYAGYQDLGFEKWRSYRAFYDEFSRKEALVEEPQKTL
ncbi:glycoside hydrolase [Metschnikowia bicuspidata var. bicuspidata NRRL YB-4993]|uniref:Glycoside hydrolase n=1 Tax=Metschnikowia bicuspidata var. bicuspidata NRRL YB-4993 TaxID=869754 RepID=A0A1A0HIE2_9ASCO|nr:glycoside hydrolase [Metschnikowia bicuspidata var. bicuspidata NRRL YB-4993]OBA23608.1 glycoside hydrolase [Metschnikowia bicuspidata var. bicuspidata NRRL YB-4993]